MDSIIFLIYQEVTLDGTSNQQKRQHHTQDNDVVVAVGAKIIGDIPIGDHAKVGVGSVIVDFVPADATVVKVPRRVLAIRNHGTDTVERFVDNVGEKLDYFGGRIAKLEKSSVVGGKE
jgi:serine O-acetyltransferase